MQREYRVDIKVRNNLIISKIEKAGFKTLLEFCRTNSISTTLFNVVNMKVSPLRTNGNYLDCIIKTSEVLNCSPEDLFSDVQMRAILKTNKRSVEVNEAEMKFMLESENNVKLLDDVIEKDQLKLTIDNALKSLSPREQKVIKLRFDDEMTRDEIGAVINVSRERVRQIETKALSKLRRPGMNNKLRQFL